VEFEDAGTQGIGPQALLDPVAITNLSDAPATAPTYELLDERDRRYGTSDVGWLAKDAMTSLVRLDPGTSKFGFLVFEVGDARQFRLSTRDGEDTARLLPLTPTRW
jgi:hypothetical protein